MFMREKGELSIPKGGYSLVYFNTLDMNALSDCLKARSARFRKVYARCSSKGVLSWDDKNFRSFFGKYRPRLGVKPFVLVAGNEIQYYFPDQH